MYKFRGSVILPFPNKTARWAYGCYFEAGGKSYIIPDDADVADDGYGNETLEGFVEVHPASVGMLIGTKDKKRTEGFPNGQSIYKGDIVSASIYFNEEPQILEIKYVGTAFVIDYEDTESDTVLLSEFMGSVEVIGNTTDDPELLEKEN